jgi:hypothetical protein
MWSVPRLYEEIPRINMVTSPTGLGPENDCAGEDQQKL